MNSRTENDQQQHNNDPWVADIPDDDRCISPVSLSFSDSSRSSSPMSFHITIDEYSGDQQPTPPPPFDPPTPPPPPPPEAMPMPESPKKPSSQVAGGFRLNDTKAIEKVERKLDSRDQMLLQIRERATTLNKTFSKEKCGPPPSLQDSLFVKFIDHHLLIDDYDPERQEGASSDGKSVVVQKDSPKRVSSEESKPQEEGVEKEEQEGEEKREEKLTGENASGEGKGGGGGGTWVNDLISYLSEWLYHVARTDDEEAAQSTDLRGEVHESIDLSPTSSFWHEWEWVLSKSEEMAIQQAHLQTKEQVKQVKEELSSLRQQGSRFRHRPFFRKSALMCFEQADEETKTWLSRGLDLSKRNKIMRDTVKALKEEWISSFDLLLQQATEKEDESPSDSSSSVSSSSSASPPSSPPKEEGEGKGEEEVEEEGKGEGGPPQSFETLFDEKPYEKNLEGAIVSMGLLASHGASKNQGLTPVLLSDICWNIWSVLTHSIRKHLEKECLDPEELDIIAREAVKAEKVVTSLWAETAKKARSGSSREGQVVEVWKEEEKVAEEKKIRDNLPPDFKYSPFKAESIVMRKSTLSPQRLTVLRSNLSLLLGGSTVE